MALFVRPAPWACLASLAFRGHSMLKTHALGARLTRPARLLAITPFLAPVKALPERIFMERSLSLSRPWGFGRAREQARLLPLAQRDGAYPLSSQGLGGPLGFALAEKGALGPKHLLPSSKSL